MMFLILLPVLFVSTLAAAVPQSYYFPQGQFPFDVSLPEVNGGLAHFNSYNDFGSDFSPLLHRGPFTERGLNFRSYDTPNVYDGNKDSFRSGRSYCKNGEVLKIDGSCDEPLVTKNIFLFAAPAQNFERPPPPQIPKPRVNYNVVFIRNPENPEDLEPIVIPPPNQKTLVYVLNKKDTIEQEVIQSPEGPIQRPEVFFINYDEGDNANLPFGIDLQTALASINKNKDSLYREDSNNYNVPVYNSNNVNNNIVSPRRVRPSLVEFDGDFGTSLGSAESQLYGPSKLKK